MREWYYGQAGQQFGPITWEELVQLAMARRLMPSDLVWKGGMPNWAQAKEIPGLFAAPAAYDPAQMRPAGYEHSTADSVGMINYATPFAYGPAYAGFWIRFCAAFIDTIILVVAMLTVTGVMGVIIGVAGMGGDSQLVEGVSGCVGNILGLVAGWLYEALFTASSKMATPGKMAVGIVVTDEYGNRISFGRATGRHFGKIVSGLILSIGYIMAAFTEKKQALHDIMAGTLVVVRR